MMQQGCYVALIILSMWMVLAINGTQLKPLENKREKDGTIIASQYAWLNHHQKSHQTSGREKKLKYSGMTFTGDRYCPNVTMGSPRAKNSLTHLATTGANFVSIVVTQYQDYINSTAIYPLPEPTLCSATPHGFCSTESDADLTAAITQAHQLGLGVMLKLQIDLVKEPTFQIWRGYIGTNMTEAEWETWFTSYTNVITHYATMANKLGVELLSVSCELVVASHRAAQWRDVIRHIRHVYPNGLLTDSANWTPPTGKKGGELTDKTWWDAVDIIGVDEYYVSFKHGHEYWTNNSFPTLAQLLRVWEPVEEQLAALHTKWNKSVILSEIGYCSGVNGTCFQNGAPTPPAIVSAESLEFQATQYEAALMALSKYAWFEGVFWWNWATDDAFGGTDNACMDPKFKPAENVLRRWYQATEPQLKPPSYPPICKCWL